MAKNAKPNIPFLGREADITFESTSYHNGSNADKVDTLIDGDINKKTLWGVLVSTNQQSWFEFTVYETVRIHAYGQRYSDSGGSTPHIVNLAKVDENGSSTTIYKTQTLNDEWYVLADKLEKGTYKITIQSGQNYSMFTEWYVEKLFDGKLLINQNNKYYSINNELYDSDNKQYNPIDIELTKDNFEKYGCSQVNQLTSMVTINGETFRPIDKFNNYNIVTMTY